MVFPSSLILLTKCQAFNSRRAACNAQTLSLSKSSTPIWHCHVPCQVSTSRLFFFSDSFLSLHQWKRLGGSYTSNSLWHCTSQGPLLLAFYTFLHCTQQNVSKNKQTNIDNESITLDELHKIFRPRGNFPRDKLGNVNNYSRLSGVCQ